jgi:DNA mismatch endonuclease, patch repair protein
MDRLDRERRSWNMSRIGGKDTKPELALRRALHAAGLRYRLHAKELPGRPDIVFRPKRLAIFVHGCFWHRHQGCRLAYSPKSNIQFWKTKFDSNTARDQRNISALRASGWKCLIVWECETSDAERLGSIVQEIREVLKNTT